MKCPVCKETALDPVILETNLRGSRCSECSGNWVRGNDYSDWLDSKPGTLPERLPSEDSSTRQHTDVSKAKLCPSCSRIMTKYLVGKDMDFALENCGGCGGMWFDKHEWELLKERNLHDEVHSFFCNHYQKAVRKESSRKNMAQIFRDRLGDQDYEEIRRVRQWLEEHPQRDMLKAYLNDSDPYEAAEPR